MNGAVLGALVLNFPNALGKLKYFIVVMESLK
jgi:hypothetical protein